MTYIVGITGGIGSGKTSVTEKLGSLGVDVIDADIVARQVVEPGSPCLAEITHYFGHHLVNEQGQLRRAELRQIIFADEPAKVWLEALLHPVIRASIITQLQASDGPYAVLVSPLLLETDQKKLVDQVVVVDAEPTQQVLRASQRDNNSGAQIETIIGKQMPRQERLASADIVFDNTRSLDHLNQQVMQLHQQLLKLAEQ